MTEQPGGCGSNAEGLVRPGSEGGGYMGYCLTELKEDNMLNLDTQNRHQRGHLAFRFLFLPRKLSLQPLNQVRL